MQALEGSEVASDRQLAGDIRKFAAESPYLREVARRRQQRTAAIARPAIEQAPQPVMTKRRPDPEIER
jgi:hypothetical protein